MDIEAVQELGIDISSNNEEELELDLKQTGIQGYSAYEVAVQNGFEGTEQEWLSSLRGADGNDGSNGADGVTPTITIGKTKTLEAGSNATVARSGTLANPIFSFGIPQGIQGEQGEQGIQGEKGDKGDKGEKGDTGTSVLDFRKVQTLPTEDISTTTIYLMRNEETSGNNLYDEWIYTDNKWEKIGNTSIDLSNYYTKQEVDDKLTNKQGNLTAGTNIEITSDNVIKNTIPFSIDISTTALNLGTTNPGALFSDSVSVGYASSSTGSKSTVLGAAIHNSNAYVIAIGSRARPNYSHSMVFGNQAQSTKQNQAVFGSASSNINEMAIYTSSGLKNLATEDYVDNIVGSINTVLATLTTPSNGGGQ